MRACVRGRTQEDSHLVAGARDEVSITDEVGDGE